MRQSKQFGALILCLAIAGIAGARGTGVDRAAIAGASETAISDDLPTQSSTVTVQSFTAVEGADLMSKLDAAQAKARARSTPYWSAYAFDVRPGVAVDATVHEFSGSINNIGDTSVLIGTTANGVTLETRNLALFLLRDPAVNQITRMEIYNLERKREYSGYPVYWMGRANNEESLNYLRAIAAASPLDMLSERAVLGIALHDDSRVGGMLKTFVSTSPNPRIRSSSVYWLGQVGGEQAFLATLVRNESEDQKIRRSAAHAIGASHDRGTMATLQSLYNDVKDIEIHRSVVSSAGNSDEEQQAFPFLVGVAKHDADVESRRSAVRQLGRFQRDDAVEELNKIFTSDQNLNVKQSVLRALAETKNPKAHARLLEVARTDANPELRKQAVRALSYRGEAAVDDLLRLYDSEQVPDVKRNTLRALSETKSPKAQARLLEVARSDANPELRIQAIRVLSERGETAVDDLLRLYDSEQLPDVKRGTLRALGETKSPKAQARVFEVARTDANLDLRKQAIRTLGDRGEAAAGDLIRLYDSEQVPEVKRWELQALSDIKSSQVEDKLFEIARNGQSPELQRQAVRLLGERAGKRSFDFLSETAQRTDGNVEVQVQAVKAIGERRSDESVALLIKIARSHQNQLVRKQAIRSLGESGDPRAVEFFREVLSK